MGTGESELHEVHAIRKAIRDHQPIGSWSDGSRQAFAQLYTDLAEQISARKEARAPSPKAMLVPGVKEGVEGVEFIAGVLKSSKANSDWVKLPAVL